MRHRRPSVRLLAFAAIAASAALTPATARAQTLPSVDTSTWRPSVDPKAGLVTEPTTSPGPWQWNVAAWFSYAQAPVVLRDATTNSVAIEPLAHVFAVDLTAGMGLGSRAAIGVDVPVFLYQDGTSDLPALISTTGSVPSSGIGDVAILGKGTLVSNDHQGLPIGFGLAALGGVTVPTGDTSSFHGDGTAKVSLGLLGEYALGVGAVRASLGYTLRTAQQTWDPSVSGVPGGLTFGDSIPWSFGAAVRPKAIKPGLDEDDRQTWEIALHGSLPATPVGPFVGTGAAALSPALLAIDDRVQLGHYHDAFVLAGIDLGLDTAIGVPSFRGIVAVGWVPSAHDRDADGVPDDRDECPDLAEDRDGIQDEDGCPEDDADGDGILDAQDACPLVPGVWWNDPKKNGCPAPDTDGDGVPDPVDACPAVKGVHSDDPKKNGCPAETQDRDKDGIPDDADRCPDEPEDKDGTEDFDGCPDPDDDGDGIPDTQDACPKEKGEPSTDPTRNGCPNPDRDGDSFDNDVDRCPDQAEVFNGIKDDDGCPDDGGKPLVVAAQKGGTFTVTTSRPVGIVGAGDQAQVDPKSEPTLRALALELNRHPDWTLGVGVRPQPGKAEEAQGVALARAMLVVNRVAALTHRPSSAEAVGWDAVKQQPGAEGGLGLVVLVAAPESK
jgi:OmpA-OmpF porin, OOP family